MVTKTLDRDMVLADLIDEVTRKLQAGEQVDADALTRQHPELADRLRELLPAMQLLSQLRDPEPVCSGYESGRAEDFAGHERINGGSVGGRALGDFRLLREVGRGGMGVVYEAEQISLGRKVAIKVLPFAAMLDARQLARFRNEARAAAALHHTNIVPVYSVGCERSVHFYAMQFIEGESLARVITQLRRKSGLLESKGRDPKSDVGDPEAADKNLPSPFVGEGRGEGAKSLLDSLSRSLTSEQFTSRASPDALLQPPIGHRNIIPLL